MRPLWLSHHHAHQADRCVRIAGVAVCRRCLVLYPVALVVGIAGVAGLRWPVSLDATLLWMLPIPAVLDLLADTLSGEHRPQRQVVATAVLAVAMGVAWLRTRHNVGDGLVWSVVGTYGLLCLAAIWASGRAAQAEATTTLEADDRLRRDRRALGSGAFIGRR